MKMFRKKFIAGDIREKIGEEPPMGRISSKSMKVPYLRRTYSASAAKSRGNIPTSIFPPSRGWTGTKLNIARATFRVIMGTAKI